MQTIVVRTNARGQQVTYACNSKIITLRGGATRTVWYFTNITSAARTPWEPQINESVRGSLPMRMAMVQAAAFVDHGILPPAEAAAQVANLKAATEGLVPEQETAARLLLLAYLRATER